MPSNDHFLSLAYLQEYRTRTFRYAPSMQLRKPQDAVDFVNERGFIHFWPSKGITFPSLWCAIAGDRPVADDHDDPGNISWAWKDQLLDKRVWYYARILKKRNTFISLETLPYFYALSPNFGDPENEIDDQYRQGVIPREVKIIYETLLEKGPLDSLALRRESRLSGPNSNTPFTRALDILQRDLRVLPVSIADAGTWHYAFVYDLTYRYYPELLEQSRFLSENDARNQILTLYFRSIGASTSKEIHMLFGWSTDQIERTLEKLVRTGLLAENVQLENAATSVYCLQSLINA